MKVYQAIAAVSAQLAKDGIGKSRENKTQGFKFRGIDETLNALAPVLSANGLVVLPRMMTRQITERESRNGGVLFSVVVEAEFDFVSAEDGTTHTVRTFGEAMDSGDKATNKAMSIAYKYAAFLAFCIPVEGMAADADETVHEVKPSKPRGYAAWVATLEGAAAQGKAAMRDAYKLGSREMVDYLKAHDGDTLTALTDKANSAANAA
jgi:hypothetical protein